MSRLQPNWYYGRSRQRVVSARVARRYGGATLPHGATVGAMEAPAPTWPWQGLQWTPVFVGFLAYTFAVITYRLPIGDISMIASLGLLLFHRGQRATPFLACFALFIAWAAAGYAQTAFPGEVGDRLYVLVKLWAIVLVAYNAIRSPAQVRAYSAFVLACFALYPLRGAFVNYYFYRSSVLGRAIWNYVYKNPNDLAAIALLMIGVCAGMLVSERKGPVRRVAAVGVAALTLLVFQTQSRAAIIGLAVFATAALVQAPGKQRIRLLAALVALAGVTAVVAPSGVWKRLGGLANVAGGQQGLSNVDEEGSATQRYEILKVALTIARDHPVFGIGVGAYPLVHHEYAARAQFAPTARGFRDAHNTYVHVAAETGVPGLLLFLGMFGFVLVTSERTRRRWRRVLPMPSQQILYLELGLVAFFAAGVFGSLEHINFAYIHSALLMAAVVALNERGRALGGLASPGAAYAPARGALIPATSGAAS